MFLIDDLLMLPAHGMMAIFREVQKAAQEEVSTGAERVRADLCELYQLLETRQITEVEFDERERTLLDRLDDIESRETVDEEGTDEQQDDSDEFSGIKHHELVVSNAPKPVVSRK